MTRQRVLFFSPYAGLWPHAMPEALVAAALRDAGADVTYVTCSGLYSRGCSVMAAHRLPADADQASRDRVCAACGSQRDLLTGALKGVNAVPIESLVSEADLAAAERLVGEVSPASAAGFEHEGLPLGRYALHETIIHFKLTDLSEMDAAAFDDFRRHLRHVLFTHMAGKRAIERYAPQCIVAYNTHISIMYALMKLAERAGVRVYGLHAGGNMASRYSSLYVFRRDMVRLYRDMMHRFEDGLGALPAHEEGLRGATDHFLALTSGGSVFVYSTPKSSEPFNVRQFFGVDPKQRIVLAALSSYDELFSSQTLGVMETFPLLFKSQMEWVDALILWARERPDVFLIIRVHPREFPNRRDPVHSAHAKGLAAAFEHLPANVKINWPSDNVSLYDLATEVDVGLNGWSSVGKELAMLGIPVVIYTGDILYYPASLNLLARTKEQYFALIDEALGGGDSFDRIRRAYRWLAVEYDLATIDISDGFTYTEARPSLVRRIYNRVIRALDPSRQQRTIARALQRPLKNGGKFARAILEDVPVVALQLEDREPLSEDEERRRLLTEVRRILAHAYPNTPLETPLMQRLNRP